MFDKHALKLNRAVVEHISNLWINDEIIQATCERRRHENDWPKSKLSVGPTF